MRPYIPQIKRVIVAVSVGTAVTLGIWALLYDHIGVFSNSGLVMDIFTGAMLPALLLAAGLSGDVHAPPNALVCCFSFLIWSLVGYVVAAFLGRKE